MTDPLAGLREAVDQLDRCYANLKDAIATGALRDARERVEREARKLARLNDAAALRARVEALEAGVEQLAASADMICDDEACSPSLVRKTLRAARDSARALLEKKP